MIKQKLPLCQSCRIQQEHRHAVLDGAVVEGNKYSHRQNQKAIDKHRGQVEPKEKKKRKQNDNKRGSEKEKRNRKRIRI